MAFSSLLNNNRVGFCSFVDLMIRIFTGTTTTAFNNDVNNIGMTEALQDLHMTHMIYPGGYTRLQDLPALAQVAPNHRLVLVSPTTVMVNGDFLDHYKDIPLVSLDP